jgi:hypothetical protein
VAGLTTLAGEALAWLEPAGLRKWRRQARRRAAESARLMPFGINRSLRARHAGTRCFILCSGPSVRQQDIKPLAGELVVSVASAYMHPDFALVAPRYHCVPQITAGALTEAETVTWFKDMDGHLGDAEVVLSHFQRATVERSGVFARRAVTYLLMDGDHYADGAEACDLTRRLPGPQSVSIMAICLAIEMGCREIYLLGTDHDQFLTGTYTHFYDRDPIAGKDPDVEPDGKVRSTRYEEFQALGRLWHQYRWLKGVARARGVRIVNASAGGALDEFERVELASLFEVPTPAVAATAGHG